MVQYYFFKVCVERNEQGQNRTVAHPLAAQPTHEYSHPVTDVTLKVQFANSVNRHVVRLQAGTVIGIKREGRLRRHIALPVYHRNDTDFYRVNDGEQIHFIANDENDLIPEFIPRADEEMMHAYRELIGMPEPEHLGAMAESAASEAPAGNPTADTAQETSTAPSEEILEELSDEMERIEDALRLHFSGNELLPKLYQISRLRDRMRLGVAKFTFNKQNGETRTAYGTRLGSLVPPGTPRSGGSTRSDGAHFAYFDIQRNAWRCFCVEDFINLWDTVLITDTEAIARLRATPVA